MACPICGKTNAEKKAVRYLPLFFRCAHCSGMYHDQGPPPGYDTQYFTEEKKPGALGRLLGSILSLFLWTRKQRILNILHNETGSILDYGCGNGKLVSYLCQKTSLTVTGVDPSPSAVTLAQKNGLPVFASIPKETQYDLIMLWHSLEHTDTPQTDLAAIIPHLKPDGKILIAVPNGDSLEAVFFGEYWFCYDWPFHRVHFTPKALRIMLGSLGFEIIETDHLNIEYTISSLIQTWLNFFLPKNALYTLAANRRAGAGNIQLMAIGIASLVLTILFSPLLLIFFLIQLGTKKTAAMIVVAKRT